MPRALSPLQLRAAALLHHPSFYSCWEREQTTQGVEFPAAPQEPNVHKHPETCTSVPWSSWGEASLSLSQRERNEFFGWETSALLWGLLAGMHMALIMGPIVRARAQIG